MAQAKIMRAWREKGMAYIALRVNEGTVERPEFVEYIGSVDLEEIKDLTSTQQKAMLVAAAKTVRNTQTSDTADLDITGNVTV